MPTIPQQQTIVQYVTNSSQLAYTFAFYAPLSSDIQVFYQASNAPPIPQTDILVLNTNYTVTYNSDPTTGGTITLLFTPTTGYYLTINRQVQASLTTDFAAAQTFNGANLDAALDRLLLLCQQNQNYALQRNLSYIINTYLPNATPYTQLPPLAQNYVWVGSGSGVIAALLATVPSASVLQSMLANNSPGTDGARLVGYYDTTNSSSTTVDAFLNTVFRTVTVQVLHVGSGTYTPTPGSKFCWARGVGSGGGSAGAVAGMAQAGVGSGSSAGAYGEALFVAQPLSYTVGAGGLAGTAGNNGAAGNQTLLGSVLSLLGGAGGISVNSGAGYVFAQGQAGGQPVIAPVGVPGSAGGNGWAVATQGGISGAGADSPFGAGGVASAGTTSEAGTAPAVNSYGAGASGAIALNGHSLPGANGADGILIIYEFG